MSPIAKLAMYLEDQGPIPTVRVSSAQAKGFAKRFAYWGAVRYEIRLTQRGKVSICPLGKATSDRRSWSLAEDDADDIAQREGRLPVFACTQVVGEVSESRAREILTILGVL